MRAAWIAADWGTTALRAWAMGPDGAPMARADGPGMGSLARDGFAPALAAAAAGWLGDGPTPAVVCGMAGAREGWAEAGYRGLDAPLAALADAAVAAPGDPRLDARILPGLRQDDPPDVMRGEETQIAGLLAVEPEFAGVVVLPGTHSKWARLAAGRVDAFRTFLTGELFAALAAHSVLRHSLAAEGHDPAAFEAAVAEALAAPARVGAALFGLRAAALLRGADPVAARSRLSGLLIGWEIAGAADFPGPVTVVGAPGLAAAYAAALTVAGRPVRLLDGEAAALDGLRLAYARLFGDTPCVR